MNDVIGSVLFVAVVAGVVYWKLPKVRAWLAGKLKG
jgi:hypothetical protein